MKPTAQLVDGRHGDTWPRHRAKDRNRRQARRKGNRRGKTTT